MKYLLILFLFIGCAKEQPCTTWIGDKWCEPKPGSNAVGCITKYDVEVKACGNIVAGSTVVESEDENVKYYVRYKHKK